LKRNQKKKVMVFLSSCNSVKFHSELLNYIDIPVLDIHVRGAQPGCADAPPCFTLRLQGKQKQGKRTATFFEFCNATHGILLCTDGEARCPDKMAMEEKVQSKVGGMPVCICGCLQLRRGVSISPRWTGSCSTTPQMTPR
jgi:ATP-dependent RNA helicase DDX18/HAS1